MEKIILICVIPFLIGNSNFTSFKISSQSPLCITLEVEGGVITIEDILLLVTLDNPNNKIQKVIIEGANDYLEYDDCNHNNCSYDLGDLKKGSYQVTVTPILGSPFTGIIHLN